MYQTTGEYRVPRTGEPYLFQYQGKWVICNNSLGIIQESRIILEKILVAPTMPAFCQWGYLGVYSQPVHFMH